jgi:endonuclease/exonuclease/phosphatase family metal-dependent hydrolase
MIKLLSEFPKVIIVGDTNLTKNDEDKIDIKSFRDVYLTYDNDKEKLYTYDGVKNPLVSNKIKSRIDRMYLKGNITFKSFNLEKDIIMSDHYAILGEIE